MTTTTAPPLPRTTFGAEIEPITVDQYHEMMKRGILPEGSPIELIDGVIVRKDRRDRRVEQTVGPRHASSVGQVDVLMRDVEAHGCHCRNQTAATLGLRQEPEPDLAVVRGSRKQFYHRHPRPDEILAGIEVSDSSLAYDRTTKQEIYAVARIPIYWIVSLVDNWLEVYTQPLPEEGRYAETAVYRPGQMVSLEVTPGQVLTFAVADMIPPAAEQGKE